MDASKGSCREHLLFIEHDSVVVHTTSVTSTTGMLSVTSNATVTAGNVSSRMSYLSQSCDLNTNKVRKCVQTNVSDIPFLFKDRFNKYYLLKVNPLNTARMLSLQSLRLNIYCLINLTYFVYHNKSF